MAWGVVECTLTGTQRVDRTSASILLLPQMQTDKTGLITQALLTCFIQSVLTMICSADQMPITLSTALPSNSGSSKAQAICPMVGCDMNVCEWGIKILHDSMACYTGFSEVSINSSSKRSVPYPLNVDMNTSACTGCEHTHSLKTMFMRIASQSETDTAANVSGVSTGQP